MARHILRANSLCSDTRTMNLNTVNGSWEWFTATQSNGKFESIYNEQIFGANAEKLFIDVDGDKVFELVEYHSSKECFDFFVDGYSEKLVFDILKWNGKKYINASGSFIRNNLRKIKSLISIKKSINPDNLYWIKEVEKRLDLEF